MKAAKGEKAASKPKKLSIRIEKLDAWAQTVLWRVK